MSVLRWIVALLALGLLMLALSGSQLRLRRPAPAQLAADCCNGKCSPPSYCSSATCKCEAGATTRDAAAPMSEPESAIFQADWINPRRPKPLERGQ